MDPRIIKFLEVEKICALTTMVNNSVPHSAAMHFSFATTPKITFYFSTDKTSRKCVDMINSSVKSALVIGINEDKWTTLQLEGEIKILSNDTSIDEIKKRHYEIHPNSKKFENDPNTVFLEFSPNWFRFTDFTTSPITVINS
jgi:general stress protein 26